MTLYAVVVHLICSFSNRDSKSGERGEHTRAIFLPLLCLMLIFGLCTHRMCIGAYFWLQLC